MNGCTTVARLSEIDSQVQRHLSSREFSRAKELLGDYYQDAERHSRSTPEWESSLHIMLKSIVHNLEAATQETKKMAERQQQRSAKRRPTLVTLADLKKALLEEEALRRGN